MSQSLVPAHSFTHCSCRFLVRSTDCAHMHGRALHMLSRLCSCVLLSFSRQKLVVAKSAAEEHLLPAGRPCSVCPPVERRPLHQSACRQRGYRGPPSQLFAGRNRPLDETSTPATVSCVRTAQVAAASLHAHFGRCKEVVAPNCLQSIVCYKSVIC